MISLISTIFATKNLAISIATYFKIVESVDGKIDKLVKKEFESGLALLEQAKQISSSYTYRQVLLTAVDRFNQAIILEKRERLLLAYLGLMTCYFYLGEIEVVKQIQKTIGDLKFSKSFWEKNGGDIEHVGVSLFGVVMSIASLGRPLPMGNSTGQDFKKDFEANVRAKENSFNKLKTAILDIKFY